MAKTCRRICTIMVDNSCVVKIYVVDLKKKNLNRGYRFCQQKLLTLIVHVTWLLYQRCSLSQSVVHSILKHAVKILLCALHEPNIYQLRIIIIFLHNLQFDVRVVWLVDGMVWRNFSNNLLKQLTKFCNISPCLM